MNPIVATWLVINGLGILITLVVIANALGDIRWARTQPDRERLLLIARNHARSAAYRSLVMLGFLAAGFASWLDDPLHPNMLLVNLFIWGLMLAPVILTLLSLYDLLDRHRSRRLPPPPGS